ncbi:MAG: hypothetical protein ACOCUH_03045 [Bacteriovoracia bacterium]
MYVKFIIIFSIFCLCSSTFSQDERFLRKMFTGSLGENQLQLPLEAADVVVKSPSYQWDLNNDGTNENIIVYKIDGLDWLQVTNHVSEELFLHQFQAYGKDNGLQKIGIYQLSNKTKLLLLHYYEGVTKYITTEGTARLYLLTIDNNNVDTLKMFRGPAFFVERSFFTGVHSVRGYKVIVRDYNEDGVKEVGIRFKTIARILSYKGNGNWVKLYAEAI